MITSGDTKVSMEFDSGVYMNKFVIINPKLNYPARYEHGISEELKRTLEISIAVIINKILDSVAQERQGDE